MLIKSVKKIIKASFLLYAFNIVAVNFNVVIPINAWTIIYISFFELPGIIVLLVMKTLGV